MVAVGKGPLATPQTGPACLAARVPIAPEPVTVRVGVGAGSPVPSQTDQFSQLLTLL